MAIINRTPVAALLIALAACASFDPVVENDAEVVLGHQLIDAPDPAERGSFGVRTLYYGSGTDRHRPEYRDSVAFQTEPVDASDLVDLGSRKKSREKYWGFGTDAFPLNARVWIPDTPGPHPLVLVVHGNHDMKDYSDPGYAYLGRHLASHGIILASVDMNFINGLSDENDGRGWMLLKHLELWRSAQDDPDHPLAGLADLDRVGLAGHSRGGEAVGHAAAFNLLDRYPDDGNVEFDFGFGIRAIAAIAPVDGQYLPTGRHVPLRDVSYLVMHGSHDGDVTSFHGLRQYQRLELSPGSDHFKSAVYMYRANHGQWNTVWNNKDWGPRSGRSLDLNQLIEPEAQRRMALVYLTAFFRATLLDDGRYLPLFRDHRTAGGWLPHTMYQTRFRHADFREIAGFEEDIDLVTGTAAGVVLQADSLDTWKEDELVLRSRNRSTTSAKQQNQALWLAWEADSTDTPAFRVTIPPTHTADLGVTGTLDFLLSPTQDTESDSLSIPGAVRDLTVRATDSSGNAQGVKLSSYGPIRSPLDIKVYRRNLDKERFGATSEIVLQGFSIPLSDFEGVEPAEIVEIALVFDRSVKGSIVVDEIGFSTLPPEFLRHGVPTSAPAETEPVGHLP